MKGGFRRYPEYRDSGVEWLGEVPVHWGVRRLKAIASIRYGLGQPPRESKHGLPLIRATNIDNGRIVQNDLIHVDPSDVPVSRDPFLKRSEIIVVRSGAYTADSAIVREPYVGAIAGCLMVVSVTGADPEFIAIALLSKYVRHDQLIAASTRSAQPHLNAEELGSAVLMLPPRPEQAAIAGYLRRQMGAIDRLVRKKERLIDLLNEERASLISEVVTRGLDPEAPTRDSGMEWLEEIPAHWEMRRLQTVVTMRVSNVDKHAWKGETPVRLCNDVDVYKHDYIGQQIDFMRSTATPEEIARFRLEDSDVLITKDSDARDGIGVPAAVTEPAEDLISGYHLDLLRPVAGVLIGSYLLRALQSKGLAHQFHVEAKGVTRYGLSHASIKSVWLPVPPLPEQATIADFLDRKTGRIDALVAKTREAIERLREYRGCVISAAVTGQIDVRESMAPT